MSTFTTKPIDALPAATALQDGSLIPVCQDGTAKKLTGAAFKTFAANAGKEQAAAELTRMLVEVVTLAEGTSPTVTKEIDPTTGAIKLIFGIPMGSGGGGDITAYVVGSPAIVKILKTDWDGTTAEPAAVGYKAEKDGIQLGLPSDSDVTNTQEVIRAALTIAHLSTSAPNLEKNTAGRVNFRISAVNVPTRDIEVAFFGLTEVSDAERVMITQTAITGVTAPVTGARAVTSIDNSQFTGTVVWNPNVKTFAASTAYTATITLTPKAGYKLAGVAANSFTVEGATSVTHGASSGVVTAVFPATAAAETASEEGTA